MKSSRSRLLALVIVAVAAFALLAHARVFDFLCDDTFITLRFSRNLARWGEPIYNSGEKVEGYTSFVWMALVALGVKFGMLAEDAVKIVGAASGVLLVASTWLLWKRVEPTRIGTGVLVLAGVVVSAPIAGWTLGGLETPLFAAMVALSIAQGAYACTRGGARSMAGVGLLLAITTLVRPEGAALFGVVGLIALALGRKRRGVWLRLAALVAGYLVVMLPFEAWRLKYYGYPLPNTFYVKTSGSGSLWPSGIKYIQLCIREMGEPLTQILIGALFVPARTLAFDPDHRSQVRRAALWMSRLFVLLLIPYIASVGGDFLDLYRFVAPIVPLIAVGVGAACVRVAMLWRPGMPRVAIAISLVGVTLVPHAWRQIVLGQRARNVHDSRREKASVEPLGWTRLYAQQWAATGRWIHAHAKPGDWMVTGAAGAMPYYADINNVDVLGLCDAWVAHNGNVIGTRPGHQREASKEYFLSKRPVWVIFSDHIEPTNKLPKRDQDWESKGYTWIVATIDEKYGAPKPFYHYFLVRTDRAAQLVGEEGVQTAIGLPE